MNRRPFVRWLGLAPVAAPAALACVAAAQRSPDVSGEVQIFIDSVRANLAADVALSLRIDQLHASAEPAPTYPFTFDGDRLTVPSLRIASA